MSTKRASTIAAIPSIKAVKMKGVSAVNGGIGVPLGELVIVDSEVETTGDDSAPVWEVSEVGPTEVSTVDSSVDGPLEVSIVDSSVDDAIELKILVSPVEDSLMMDSEFTYELNSADDDNNEDTELTEIVGNSEEEELE